MRKGLLKLAGVLALGLLAGCQVGTGSDSSGTPQNGPASAGPTKGAAPTSAGSAIVIDGTVTAKTIDCGGRDVEVKTTTARVTLNGTCPTVTINGDVNKVNIGTAGTIVINGSGNKVYWKAAQTGAEPTVKNSGSANVIAQGGDAQTAATGTGSNPVASGQIDGDGITRTYACQGGDIVVGAASSHLTFTGQCGAVEVQGGNNTIVLEAATALEVKGAANQVTVGQAGSITVQGAGNTVVYHTGSPKITRQGLDNTVRQG
jgi:hypothetical protein